jgi:phosphoribosylformylglycinamidine synthase PurS subunit
MAVLPLITIESVNYSFRKYSIGRQDFRRDASDVPQEFSRVASAVQAMTGYTAIVTVRLKEGVLDPEAETTQHALERLGFELESLRSAERFEIDFDAPDHAAARERAEEMTERLLANPTIHDYAIDIEEQ